MKTLLACCALSIPFALSGQNPYYDALKLRAYIEVNSQGEQKFVIPVQGTPEFDAKVEHAKAYSELINTNYYNNGLGSIRQVHLALSTSTMEQFNPFLEPFLTPSMSLSGAPSAIQPGRAREYSGLGKLDVTNIADGFARFIVERTKKELQAAFFDRFIEDLEDSKYADLKTLFPSTMDLVKKLPEKIYTYDIYLQSLRDAFGQDMLSILPHLEQVLRYGEFRSAFQNHPELLSICLTAVHFGKELQNGQHIGQALELYNPMDPDYDFSTTDPEVNIVKNNAIRFVQEVSKSLKTKNTSGKEYWVSSDSIQIMLRDPITFRIYLGLLYTKLQGMRITSAEKTYAQALFTAYAQGSSVNSFIRMLSSKIDVAQHQIHELQALPVAERKLEDYMHLFRSSTDVMMVFRDNEFITHVQSQLSPPAQERIKWFWKKYNRMVDGATSAVSIYSHINDGQYSMAIQDVRGLYEMRYPPDKASDKETTAHTKAVLEFLLEKGALIAGVAEAHTSAEVAQAIDRIALPPGSARIKRLSTWNVSVNAFSGLYAGYERIYDLKEEVAINAYGVSAPIGIAFSKGTRKGHAHSLSLMFVDIGAVAAFRFTNEIAEQVPTIQLGDIFAPGLVYSFGIRRSPISINAGVQAGPNLRKVNIDVNEYAGNTSLRYNVAFCVDLPLFNLYTKK